MDGEGPLARPNSGEMREEFKPHRKARAELFQASSYDKGSHSPGVTRDGAGASRVPVHPGMNTRISAAGLGV